VGEHLEQLDLAQGGDGEAILFVVYQDLFERDNGAGALGAGLGHDAKSALAQLLYNLVVVNLGATAKAALAGVGRGHVCRSFAAHGWTESMRAGECEETLGQEGGCLSRQEQR
jgi:hypothetical protein